ncbi:MAG: TIGR04076 family protein [Asgard group archaeon]|nr:TIGR04076 family protein [Asgard group archaeon]
MLSKNGEIKMPYKIKITVIKRFNPKEIFGKEMFHPDGRKIIACSVFDEGQEIIIDDLFTNQPNEFKCNWAWHDLYKDISVLSSGGDFNHTDPGITYTACRDGMRPVIFKIERITDNK